MADDQGSWRMCRFDGSEGGLAPDGPVVAVPPPTPPVTVALAIPKGERAEWAVQKLTEVGVDRIVPLLTGRGVVRWSPERAGRQALRWEAVARAAAAQSRRVRLPSIAAPTDVAGMLACASAPVVGEGLGCVLAEPGGGPLSLDRPTVLVGPEGGWTPEELGAARDARAGLVALGAGVLRTETAAVVAGALFVALREGLVGVA